MVVLIGYAVVVGSIFGGYALAGGHLGAMYQPLELLSTPRRPRSAS